MERGRPPFLAYVSKYGRSWLPYAFSSSRALGDEQFTVGGDLRMVVQAVDQPGRAGPWGRQDDERCGAPHALETLETPPRFPPTWREQGGRAEEHECGIYG